MLGMVCSASCLVHDMPWAVEALLESLAIVTMLPWMMNICYLLCERILDNALLGMAL